MMSFDEISTDAHESDRDAYQWKYDLDIATIRIQLKDANKAAKSLYKEQRNIQRKREKTDSKNLPKCMETYDENLATLEEAFSKISPILGGNIEESGFTNKKHARSRSWNVLKKKDRKRIGESLEHNQSTECILCLSKENIIKNLREEKERIQRTSEQSITQLTESVDDLQTRLANLQQKYQEELTKSVGDLETKLANLQQKYREEVHLKEDALLRLSKTASSKSPDDIQNFSDLSDPNRPSKIAEKMSELFDNQWTDAFDFLEKGNMDENQIIAKLRTILVANFQATSSLKEFNRAWNYRKRLLKSQTTDKQKQEIREFRKTRATYVLREIEQVVRPRLPLANEKSKVIQAYVSLCVEIGWLCAVQDPSLILDADCTKEFDTNKFKGFTKRGKYVEFVVWPAMLLHKEGPLLSKGVAEGCDQNLSWV